MNQTGQEEVLKSPASNETVDVKVKTSLFGRKTELFRLRVPKPNRVEKHMVPKINEDDLMLVRKIDQGETVLDIIGEGVYGMVLRAVLQHKGHREQVVVKFCHRDYADENVLREAQFLQHLQGTGYVPRLYGMVHHQGLDGLCIVQALFAGGVTLASVMGDFDKLPETVRRHVAWNLAFGLKAIHRTGVVLNDLHAGNVLVDLHCPHRPSIRYIDLGLASYGAQLFTDQDLEEYWHLAPEFRAQGRSSPEADVYSLGIVIRQLNRCCVNCGQMAQAVGVCLDVDPLNRDLDLVLFHLRDDGERTRADRPTRGWRLPKFFSRKTTQRSRDK